VLQDVILQWVTDLYPLGSASLYDDWSDYILVSLDDVSPGLAFNSQGVTYAKWIFDHDDTILWHPEGEITVKINNLLAKHPVLQKCVVKRNAAKKKAVQSHVIEYAWFNVYCVPGWGERFKKNEQVHAHIFHVPWVFRITLRADL
jgi:hypothetical protein